MRKKGFVLVVCLLLLLLLPGLSKAEKLKFGVKLSGGMNYLLVGDPNEGIKGYFNVIRDGSINPPGLSVLEGQAKPIHLGLDFEGDIIINLTPKIGIGVGAGYIQGSRTSEITVRFLDGASEMTGSHELKVSAIPIRLGAYYTLSMNNKINVFFNTGAGLYLAKYSYNKDPVGTGECGFNQRASANGLGFHGGVGFEYELTPNIAFVLEGQGRYAKIGGFEGKIEHSCPYPPFEWTEEGTLYYWEAVTFNKYQVLIKKYPQVYVRENKPSGSGISNVREAKVDFSGFNFLVGIKINF